MKNPTSARLQKIDKDSSCVLDAINGTGADDDSKFVVSADLIDGVSGMTATTTAVAGFLDITSTSRDVSATEFVFANISTGCMFKQITCYTAALRPLLNRNTAYAYAESNGLDTRHTS